LAARARDANKRLLRLERSASDTTVVLSDEILSSVVDRAMG
jgi:hypothetical protein